MRSPPEHGPLHFLPAFEAGLGAERDRLVGVPGAGSTPLGTPARSGDMAPDDDEQAGPCQTARVSFR